MMLDEEEEIVMREPELKEPVLIFLPGVHPGTCSIIPSLGLGAKENVQVSSTKNAVRVGPNPTLFALPRRVDRPASARSSTSAADSNDESENPSPTIAKPQPLYMKRRNLETKPASFNTISRLFAYSGHMPIEALGKNINRTTPRELAGSDVEKCTKWSKNVAPELFWSPLPKKENGNDEWDCFEIIHRTSTSTASKYMSVVENIMRPNDKVKYGGRKFEAFKFLCSNIAGLILSSEKRKDTSACLADDTLEQFYTCGFRAVMYMNEAKKSNSVAPSTPCSGCSDRPCVCTKIATLFVEANMALQGLGLMDELAGPRLYAVVKKQTGVRVDECCSGKYETSHLNDLLEWLNCRVLPWIDTIYPHLSTTESESEKLKMREEFTLMLLEVYGKAIIKDMFSVIIEFPDSQPVLEDLRKCMKQVNLRNALVSSLKASLERRLLNAGVNTTDVLDAYVATVRALKFVDPSGILVQLVTPPVREYLKHREETVRVILVSLTEESGDLAEELSRNPTYADRKNRLNMASWKAWEPDPMDVPKDKHNLRKSDLIQALVSIYGSKTLFIDEYRALLADRLLRMPKPGSITREIKCLELLKLRFGDSDLQKCEVMLKDVSDSQRLNIRFYEEEGAVLADQEVGVTGLVVSAQFWPSFKQETLELPKPISEALEKYTKAFEMIKGNRTLEWQKHIGNVEIELDHGGVSLNLTVSPAQATIIWHFQEKDTWSLADLSEVTATPVATLRSRVSFWTSKGILVNAGQDVFSLHEGFTEGSQATGVTANKYVEEAEVDSPMTSTSSQRETELQMFWSYIEGMLTNLESLPLGRIHSMLKLFATVECSADELQKFLDDKVSQNLLVYSAGQYQLPK